jgi:regulator of CtrA degradation
MSEKTLTEAQPVSFGERLASSQAFADLFRDGMALVEETATYLDGPGRQQSKKLERTAALAYATESMRLTTRLMQLASWLLLHRAVKEGEMSLAQASKEKAKVKLSTTDGHDPANV